MEVADFVHEVYVGRCKDVGERPRKEDDLEFGKLVLSHYKGSQLSLRESRIGPNATFAIAKMLKSVPTIKSLDLYGNVIYDAGAIALMDMFNSTPNAPLQSLNLGCNDIWDEGGKAIGEMLKFNKNLRILDLGAGTTYCMHDNNLGYLSAVAIAEGLEFNRSVTSLGLNRNLIGEVNSEGAEALGKMLKANKTLSSLKIAHNFLGSRGGMFLADALLVNTTLTYLDLTDNALGPDVASLLAQALASGQSSLITLNLGFNKLGPRGVTSLGDSLKLNTSLVVLNLEENGIGDFGATAVADALYINRTITYLNLSGNGIGKSGGSAIANAMTEHDNILHTLILNNNPILDDSAVAFADALKSDEGLTILELNSTKIATQGGTAIAKALENNHTLSTLKLCDNFLTEGAGQVMADAFLRNSSLTVIDVSGNQVNHTTANLIKKTCKKNRATKKLAEAAPLKLEIIRLRQEQGKLPTVEAQLAMEMEAVGNAERVISMTEAQIEAIKQDSELESSTLRKKLDDVNSHLAEEEKKLRDREEELRKIQDDYDQKIKELQLALTAEIEGRDTLERQLKEKSDEIEVHSKLHADKIQELTQQIEQTRRETAQFRQMERECQAEYQRLEDEKQKLLPSMSQASSTNKLSGKLAASQKLPDIKMQKSPTSLLQNARSGNMTKLKSGGSLKSSSSRNLASNNNSASPSSDDLMSLSSSSSGSKLSRGTASVEKLPTKIKTVNLNVAKSPSTKSP